RNGTQCGVRGVTRPVFGPELSHCRPATGFRPASGGEVWRTLRASGPRPKLGAKRAYTRARLPTSSLRLLGSAGVRTSDTRNPAGNFATAWIPAHFLLTLSQSID